MMEKQLKESVGTLLAHVVKAEHKDIEKVAPLFCEIMGQNFNCTNEEAKSFLYEIMGKEYDLDKHIEIIKKALGDDQLTKLHILEHLNHIIYADTITDEDYKIFEKIRDKLIVCDD